MFRSCTIEFLSENKIKLLISEYRVTNALGTQVVMNKCHRLTEDNYTTITKIKKIRTIFVQD